MRNMKHIETKIENNRLIQKCVCGVKQTIEIGKTDVKFMAKEFEKKHRKCADKLR